MPSERKPTSGNNAELFAMLRCSQLGYFVSIPMGGKAPYDFIADSGIRLSRIQVKTIHRCKTDNGTKWVVDFMKPRGSGNHKRYVKYTESDCDFIVAVCVEHSKCFVFPIAAASKMRQATFYFDETKPPNSRLNDWSGYLDRW
jgi:hypothetical protein